jgi:hypothetical protein
MGQRQQETFRHVNGGSATVKHHWLVDDRNPEMPARFEKDDMKILDGYDQGVGYQMVPALGGTAANSFPWRFMTAVTDNHACKLRVDDPKVIQLLAIEQPPKVINDIVIPPNRRMDFLIAACSDKGGTSGVQLEDVDLPGAPMLVATIFVSVKTEVTRKYALLFLADKLPGGKADATKRSMAEATRLMQLVQATYLWQANVNLIRVGAPTNVVVPRDLGDPLDIDNDNGVVKPIVAATPALFQAQDIIRVYCCWDVADATVGDSLSVIGDTKGSNCFVEDGTREFTFAHELGHALGLRSHNFAAKPTRPLLMDENLSTGSLKLEKFEIDLLNPSGKFGQ